MSNNHFIIGLGGTGGKVIRELRKIIERNQSTTRETSSSEARFEYLYVDTSTDVLDQKDEWKVLGKEVDLARSQYLVNAAGSVRPILNDPVSYPGLKDWIEPRHVFDFVNATTAGAAQRRKLGRLVFAQNAARFVDACSDRIRTLETGTKQGVVIHIVCGLAGGTGSGSIVDAVAQIREKYQNNELYRILVYAVLPEKNSKRVKNTAGSATYYANGFAALSELNAMAVGKYHPTNLLNGQRLAHDIYFNGCYLINDINEHGIPFDIDTDVPLITAEFIFQKTMNSNWEGLQRAEKGENDIKNFECDKANDKAHAKLFLSFGIKRVVVPEEEIKEYLAFGFADQVTRQLMYNNFRQGEGYADEAVEKDWSSEVRKPETAQELLLTNAHLTLETGILEDDAKNTTWKFHQDYWKAIVSRLVPEIQADKTIEQTTQINVLNTRLAKVFDDTFRTMGGVRKFYEIKGKARLEMARHIGRHIEKILFARWRSGGYSLAQLREFVDALTAMLEERLAGLNDQISRMPTELEGVQQRIAELSGKFNEVGFLRKHLTDRRESLFADLGTQHQDLYILRTKLEGFKFASNLIPFIKEQLLALRSNIDELHQRLAKATEKVNLEKAARLGAADAPYQKRIFDQQAIDSILKAMIVDEAAQSARTQRIRQSIINLAGADIDSFDRLAKDISLSSMISTLTQDSAQTVEMAHAEIAKILPPVLHVNIVERLQKKYDANPSGLKTFVTELYNEAGAMLPLNKSEVGRVLIHNQGGSVGQHQTVGVFLPECESQKDFRDNLAKVFENEKDPASNTQVTLGRLPNQIVIVRVASLMPVRFVDSLGELKRHYDGILTDANEAILLHGEGDGSKLPPLFALSASDLIAQSQKKPYLLLARLLGLVKERQNKTSGQMEWVLTYLANGLPKVQVLNGKTWWEVLDGDLDSAIQATIEKEVKKCLDAEYKHLEKKKTLRDAFRKLVLERFEEAGEDDQDPIFVALSAMQAPLLAIIALPDDED